MVESPSKDCDKAGAAEAKAAPPEDGGDLMVTPSERERQDRQLPPPRSVYTRSEIYFITFMASTAALFSTISAPIYLPVIPVLSDYFDTTTEMINLTVTMYSIFQGLSPSIWCPLSDSIGRRPVYLGCVIMYIGANIGLALSTNYAMLFVFRCLQSAGIASTVAIGSGVVADVTARKDRGYFIGIFSGFSLIGNAFGPLIGGGLSSGLGWRSIFWFLIIAAAIMLIILLICMPETNRFIAHDGSVIPAPFINKSPYIYIRKRIKGTPSLSEGDLEKPMERHPLDLMLSFRMFRFYDVLLVLIPASLHYTTWFMILTSQASLLDSEYGFSTLQTGLSYLASGISGLIGSLVSGRMMGWYYNRCLLKHKQDPDRSSNDMSDFNIVRARLDMAVFATIAMVSAALIFGWTIQYKVHFIVPILATALASFSSVYFMNLVSTLLVDLFPQDSASSTACLNLTRCLICAGGLAAVDSMVKNLGAGGAFTIMAGFCALSLILVYTELKVGHKLYMKRNNIDVA